MNWWNVQTPDGDWVAGSVRVLSEGVRVFDRTPERKHAADFTKLQAQFIAKAIGGTAHEGRFVTEGDC